MATCDLCGNPAVYMALVEGAELNVCKGCVKHGRVIKEIKPEPKIKYVQKELKTREEPVQVIVPNYPILVREARERKGLKQEELAKSISEKVSLVHNLEVGRYEPSIKIAQKLERFLRIRLVQKAEEKVELPAVKRGESYTIGDLIKIRKR